MKSWMSSIAVILLVGLFATEAGAGYKGSVSAGAGYFFPNGKWTQHRYAPGVKQFGGRPQFTFDLEYRFNRKWSMALISQFNGLDTSEWEKYVQNQGEYVDAEAQMFTFGLELRPHVSVTSTNRTMLAFGFGITSLYGNERYGGYSYDYDFLTAGSVSLLAAVEHDWLFDKRFALVARVGIFYLPAGVNYADGESQSVVGYPLSAGIRFLM